jgi:SAM-dependent methyltransferase
MSETGYHDSRLTHDKKRNVVWKALWQYFFSKRIGADDCVLDLGCGYGEFINNVSARRRIAVDSWEGMPDYLDSGVEGIVGSVTDLSGIERGAVDYAFSSNLFEHLTKEALAETLNTLKPRLSKRGTLTTLQPNYRYCASEYFDDFTHVSIWSHVSLADFFKANGYDVLEVRPRFLPLTVKSRLPVSQMLVGAYLASPVKPLGKQMLIVARPRI